MAFQRQESEQPYRSKHSDTVMEEGKPQRNYNTTLSQEETEDKPIHPCRFLLAFVLTFVIISIVPCLLLFISTIVAGPATVDATPDLFDRSTG